jgi:hypothetical protein
VVAPNYPEGNSPPEECEYVLSVERQDPEVPSGWSPVGEIVEVWTMTRAHSLMWRIGQCGVIVYGPGEWESPGRFYHAAELRVTAVRQPPCATAGDGLGITGASERRRP